VREANSLKKPCSHLTGGRAARVPVLSAYVPCGCHSSSRNAIRLNCSVSSAQGDRGGSLKSPWRDDLPRRELIGVSHEFWIGAGAEFVEVGPVAFVFRRNALRGKMIE